MPELSAGLAVRQAGQRTRDLLFPFSVRRWAAACLGLFGLAGRGDPVVAELRRLRPYYKGTRLLATGGLLLVALAFALPVSVVFVGLGGFYWFLIGYIALLVVASLLGVILEVTLDAIFAIQQEQMLQLPGACRTFLAYLRSKGSLVLGYMGVKLVVDMALVAAALAAFMPAMLAAIALMQHVTNAVLAGVDVRRTAAAGLLAIFALALLGLCAVILLLLMSSAFYGYYTEAAVKMMQE